MSRCFVWACLAGFLAPATSAAGEEPPATQPSYGWRGNWTGLYPQADPPVEWSRTARGMLAGLKHQADRPAEDRQGRGAAMRDGVIRHWLILGPLPVENVAKDFDKEQLPGEAELAPAAGQDSGRLTWKPMELAKPLDIDRWGTTELEWADLAAAVGYKPNHVAYAHAYLLSPQAGPVRLIVEHAHGLKVWINGKAIYSQPKPAGGLGSYVGISRQKKALVHQPSPAFTADLRPGWNRLLVKVGSYHDKGWREMKFALRVMEAQDPPYEEKNILWAAVMPERTNASPVVAGGRILTPAEPDELLCLDALTGRVLWRQFSALCDAAGKADRRGDPALWAQVDQLAAQRGKTMDCQEGMTPRRQIAELLTKADKAAYDLKWDGHLEAHFGIVGFTTTPVSDGRFVYAFYGYGVVACYDLDGNRKWIRRLPCQEIRYSCSPAVIGGRVAVLFDGLHALDAATGAVLWTNPKVQSTAALIPARIAGTDVVFTRQGEVFRMADGKCLWANPHIRQGDTGWGAPTILGEVMYLAWLGVGELIVADFAGVSGEEWKPKIRVLSVGADHRRPDGKWLDRHTASSPLVHDGIYYNIDQYGVFYALDLATGKPLYKQDVGFDELHHYNAIGVGASATLAGRNIFVVDNQGACVVLQVGREYRRVAINSIESLLRRDWPIGPQEILSNGAPVFDGPRMYIRGEQHLFCIGRPAGQDAGGAKAP